MERLIEEKRKEGVFLTVLGFGMGNYKDSKMEILADKVMATTPTLMASVKRAKYW